MLDPERRQRLAADLELLGAMGDPTRGVLAELFTPPAPAEAAPARPRHVALIAAVWRRGPAALLAWRQRLRARRPARARPAAGAPAMPLR